MRINYKDKKVLTMGEATEQEVSFAVEDAKLQLQSDILATKRVLESKKSDLEVAKTGYPLEPKRIIDLMNEVEAYEDGVKKLEKLSVELGFSK